MYCTSFFWLVCVEKYLLVNNVPFITIFIVTFHGQSRIYPITLLQIARGLTHGSLLGTPPQKED